MDSFLDDLDDAFDALILPSGAGGSDSGTPNLPGEMKLTEREQNEVENLFLSISSAYLQPVKDFISELQSGSVSKGWVDICLSSIRMIEDAGTKMSYEKMNQIVERFKQLMLRGKLSDSTYISREIRLRGVPRFLAILLVATPIMLAEMIIEYLKPRTIFSGVKRNSSSLTYHSNDLCVFLLEVLLTIELQILPNGIKTNSMARVPDHFPVFFHHILILYYRDFP